MTRQHRGLSEIQVLRRLREIILGSGIGSKVAAAQVRAIEIKLQDLVLGQPSFQPNCQERLVYLAADGALIAEKQILGKLLGDGRAAPRRLRRP